MSKLTSLCVFCGSSLGADAAYREAALELGGIMASQGIRLVYGGARVGIMGAVAEGVLAAGGQVVGVIPKFLEKKEITNYDVTDLRIVDTMHERKALMSELSDGYIAAPGGIGTMEELCEVFTWCQLGLHAKPCGVLNTAAYYGGFLEFVDHMASQAFIKPDHRHILVDADEPAELLERMRAWKAPTVPKWLKATDQT